MTEGTVQSDSNPAVNVPDVDGAGTSRAGSSRTEQPTTEQTGAANDSVQPATTRQADSQKNQGASLTVMVQRLLQDCPSKQAVYDTVLNVCRERLPASVVRADYRVGAVLLSEIRHDERVAEAAAKKFSEKFLAQLAQEVRTSKTPEAQFKRFERGDQKMMVAASPVIDIASGQVDGVITLMMGGSSHRPEFILPVLDGITASVSAALMGRTIAASKQNPPAATRIHPPAAGQESPQASVPTAGAVLAGATAATAAAVQPAVDPQVSALSRASKFSNLKEFGYTLVNTISNQLQCEQVAFGSESRSKIKLQAISGVADFKPSSPGVASIRQAMEECLDEEASVAYPEIAATADQAIVVSRPIHQQWSSECNQSSVCSVPLTDGGDVVAVVSLRRSGAKPFTQQEIAKLSSMLESYGPSVRVVEKAGQPVGSRIKSAVQTKASSTMQKGAWGRRIALAGLLLASLWFLFGTLTYKPLCRSTITAANLRHFSAPFDGQLKSVLVKPGQRVTSGEALVEFDTSDLELEEISLQRQIASLEVQVKQSVSEGDLGQASMANARLAVLSTEIQAVRKRISEATVVAPADGVVVLSDLQQRIGQAFPQGEEILQFVVDGDWLLEIEVPDNIVSMVSPEQSGTFAPASDPTNKHEFRIQHVDGAASVIKDRNVFLARATFANQPQQMMTGMEGTSKLITVDRPVWWVALHGVIDWARMNFWL